MNTALTPLGKELRKLRIDAGERIADLATALSCTSSLISAIELGKRSPTSEFLEGVVAHYNLDIARASALRAAAAQSMSTVRIDLEQGNNDLSRELAVAFARAFPTIDSDKAAQLLDALNSSGRKGGSR